MSERDNELEALASYDFSDRNEDDVRGDWIEPLLRLLGYGLGTRNRIERGRTLTLRPPIRSIGSTSVKFDFKPTVLGRGLWVIEAKKPVKDLFSQKHLGQMWMYATDPRVDVPLGVLCDGQRLGVFDLTLEVWDIPELEINQKDLPRRFDELDAVLGARRVAEWVRIRQLRHLRLALTAELDLDALNQTIADVTQIVREVGPEIQEIQRTIASDARAQALAHTDAIFERSGTWGLAGQLNGPIAPRFKDIADVVEAVLKARGDRPNERT